MSIPFAAAGAVLAALFETSVLPGVMIAGAKPDLVFVLSIVATMMIGVEDGLTWAFIGGLMLDFLLPDRAVGMTSLVLLGLVGVAVVLGHFVPSRRIAVTALVVFLLSFAYQALVIVLLAVTSGTSDRIALGALVPSAVLDGLVALVAGALARTAWLRLGAHDRIEW